MATENIPSRLHCVAEGNVLAGANEILDDDKGKKQTVINQENDQRLETLEAAVGTGGSVDSRIESAKTEIVGGASSDCNTLGKAEALISTNANDIAALQEAYAALTQNDVVVVAPADTWPVATPEQNIIYRVVDRTNTPPQYYTDYMWNGTALVEMAQYNNAIDPRPKKASQNLVTSGGVFDNMGALDVSELNATENPHTLAKYVDLSAALAAIPTDYQKGGMSIKFVQSSDNKYVQFRCKSQSFSTNTDDWESIEKLKDYFSYTTKAVTTNIDLNSINWLDGYVDYHNGVETSAFSGGSCKLSYPIFLYKGQTIEVTCSGYSNVLSIISKVLQFNNTSLSKTLFLPLVREVGTKVSTFLYTAHEDMYVSVSYYYGNGDTASIRIYEAINDNIDDEIEDIEINKGFLKNTDIYTTSGYQQFAGWYSSDFIDTNNIKRITYLKNNTFLDIYVIAFFDENKNFVSGILPTESHSDRLTYFTNIDIPQNAKYYRINSVIPTPVIIYGHIGVVYKELPIINKLDLTNKFVSHNQWKDAEETSSYESWFTTDYIYLENIRLIKKLKTSGHTLLNSLTLFDKEKRVTRFWGASQNNVMYTLENVDIFPYEKYAVISWGEIEINNQITRSDEVEFIVENIKESVVIGEDYSYLPAQFDNILCIGDSLTEGDYGSYPEGTANNHSKNYPHYLQRYLNTEVTNVGKDGTYPVWWWNNKTTYIDTTKDYDCIFFFLGTNFGLTDTIDEDTSAEDYADYADTQTGRYCSMLEWLADVFPNAKIFLISFPHNYRLNEWFVSNNTILKKIGSKYGLPVVDMTVDVPFTRYNGDLYRPVGYNPDGTDIRQKFGNLHFGTLGYQTFAKYLIRNTGKVMQQNLIDYKGLLT